MLTESRREYILRDHLCSPRLRFAGEPNGAETVLQADAYYPYGMRIPGESYVSGDYDNRLLNDKRLEEGHGLNWMDYGWRQYDPAIGRWTMVDPADEFHTLYGYVGGICKKHRICDSVEVPYGSKPVSALGDT